MASHITAPMDRAGRSRVLAVVLAGLFALSPIIFDWGLHLVDTPSARYAALFPVLYLIGLRRDRTDRIRNDGYWLLAVAIVVVILTVGGGYTRWGRIAVPITAVALARVCGYGTTRGALTMLWFVPLPHLLDSVVWPQLALFYTSLVPGLSVSPEATSLAIRSSDGLFFRLPQGDAGLVLMASLTGVRYFAGWQQQESLGRTFSRMIAWGLAALPIQGVSIVLALLLLQSGSPGAAAAWLHSSIWIFSIGLLLATVHPPLWQTRMGEA